MRAKQADARETRRMSFFGDARQV